MSVMHIIVRVQVNKCGMVCNTGNSWLRPASIGCLHRLFSHAIRYIAPTPVVEYTAPTPIVCTAPTPVVEYIDLIPAVSCVAPALVVKYIACSGFRYLSNIVPVVSLGFTMLVAHSLRDMFGVALGTLGILGTLTMGLTIDACSLISVSRGDIVDVAT